MGILFQAIKNSSFKKHDAIQIFKDGTAEA